MKKENVIKGFKGFDKNLKCRDMQYEIGKEYETDKKPIRCTANGYHLCEDALDVFTYYPPLTSRFCVVDGSGDVDRAEKEDSKIAVSKVKIGAELNLFQMIKLGVECVLKRVKATTGNSAHSATTGNSAHSATTGYSAHSATTGKESIACGIGIDNQARASIGSWIVLSEWKIKNGCYCVKTVKSFKVDGKKIKADTWYKISNGKPIIVEE
jgi:hypothetical protein